MAWCLSTWIIGLQRLFCSQTTYTNERTPTISEADDDDSDHDNVILRRVTITVAQTATRMTAMQACDDRVMTTTTK
jgi:hypothetical protein